MAMDRNRTDYCISAFYIFCLAQVENFAASSS